MGFNASDERVVLFQTFPVAWGDSMLNYNMLRDFKSKHPTAIVYGVMHSNTICQSGHNAIYEGLLDTIINVPMDIWSTDKFINYILEELDGLKFHYIILSWSSTSHLISLLQKWDLSNTKLIFHVNYIDDALWQPYKDYWDYSAPPIPHFQAFDISHAIVPIKNILNKDKKTLTIFPLSSNNMQCINRDGLSAIYSAVHDKFNIILLGLERKTYGNSNFSELVYDEIDLINLIGYSSLKQIEICKLSDVILVTSGSIVHPLLYPKKAILLNTFTQRLQGYGIYLQEPFEVVNPLCDFYPCDEYKLNTNSKGQTICKANDDTAVSLCASTKINIVGIIEALNKLC